MDVNAYLACSTQRWGLLRNLDFLYERDRLIPSLFGYHYLIPSLMEGAIATVAISCAMVETAASAIAPFGCFGLLAVTGWFKQINASVREDESVWLPRYHLCSPVIVTDALVPGLCGAASRLRCNGLSRAGLISRKGDFFGSFARRLQPRISWGGSQSRRSFSVRLLAAYSFRLHILA